MPLTCEGNRKIGQGNFIARVTNVGNENYTLEGATGLEQAWSIAFLETDADIILDADQKKPSSGWYTSEMHITAPEGFTFSYDKVTWMSEDQISTNGNHAKAYYLKNASGQITEMRTVSFSIDSYSPIAEIKIKKSSFKTFMNSITFGLFFKNSVDVSIAATDGASGLTPIEYQLVENEADYNEDGPWTVGAGFSISADKKCIVYARVTDNAGNVLIINSTGLVVYSDNAIEHDDAVYVKTTKTDLVTGIDVGNNTVSQIVLEGNPIDAANYTVNQDKKLVLDGEYLDAFSAGYYDFTVSYNPMGEAYVDGEDNEAPADTVITLHVVKAEGAAQITNTLDKVYDGNEIDEPAIDKASSATAIVTYTEFGQEAYTAEKPVSAGSYTVKVVVPEDEDYSAVTITENFEISRAAGKITISEIAPKIFDGSAIDKPEESHFGTGLVYTEYKVKGDADDMYREAAPYEAGTYVVRMTVQGDRNYEEAVATREFTIEQRQVTVTADDAQKTFGEQDGTLTYSTEGLPEGFELSEIHINRAAGEDVGTYAITVGQAEDANPDYAIQFVDGVFEITKKVITEANAVVTLGDALVNTGKAQTQEVALVMVDGTMEATFDVTDNEATDPGKYVLTITGNGNYEGEINHTFVVVSNTDAENDEIGRFNVEVSKESALNAVLENSKSEMIQMLLTANELAAVADDDGANMWVEVTDITDSISNESKKAIADGAKGYEVGRYIEISLFKKLDSQEDAVQIHETDKMVRITVTLPDSLLTTDANTERTFFAVRNHNDAVAILEGDFDAEAKTFTFESDRFSDFAIVYKDVVNTPNVIPAPIVRAGEATVANGDTVAFTDSIVVTVDTNSEDSAVKAYYTVGDGEEKIEYTGPITLTETTELRIFNGREADIGDVVTVLFTKNDAVLLGDVNGDGAVNMKDVLMLRKQLAGMNPEGYHELNADMNQDKAVNMKDVLALRKFLAGIK